MWPGLPRSWISDFSSLKLKQPHVWSGCYVGQSRQRQSCQRPALRPARAAHLAALGEEQLRACRTEQGGGQQLGCSDHSPHLWATAVHVQPAVSEKAWRQDSNNTLLCQVLEVIRRTGFSFVGGRPPWAPQG